MPFPRMVPLLVCLWPCLTLGQAQTPSEPPKEDTKTCVSNETEQEALRLGRNLGLSDSEVLEAYGQSPCETLANLRNRTERNSEAGNAYVKCAAGSSQVFVWLAPGNLSTVATAKCGEKLAILQNDDAVWVKVHTQDGATGYIPRVALEGATGYIAPATGVDPATAVVKTPQTITRNVAATNESGPSCHKVVSFALADATGVHPFMGTGNWIGNWVRKNGKKYPDVCFSQAPIQGRQNYLIALSQAAGYLTGFDPVVRTSTSTSTSPVSGSGTVTDNYGGMWNYTYSGTVTTTTTTTTNDNVPYSINSNTVYANAYDEHGTLISRRWHVYSTKSGGDAANSFGYNLGNALAAINARGHLIGSVVKDIEGK